MPDFKPGDIVELTRLSIGMAVGRYMAVRLDYGRLAGRIRVTPLTGLDATESGRTFIVRTADCRLILPFSDLNALLDQISTESTCPSPSASQS